MRIGQVLVEAGLINDKDLAACLDYGKAKGIALGRVLKLMKIMEDEDVERALRAQRLIRLGLSPVLAIEGLKKAVQEQIALETALQERCQATIPQDDAPEDVSDVKVDESMTVDRLLQTGDKFLIEDQCVEAEAYYLAAKKRIEIMEGEKHIDLCPCLIRLGNTFMATDRYAEAESAYKEVIDIKSSAYTESHPQVAQAYESLGDLYRAYSDENQATETFLKALDILEGLLPQQLGYYAAVLRKVTAVPPKKDNEPTSPPIGELLKSAGILTDSQLQIALKMSKQSHIPLGIVLRENCIVTDRELQSVLKCQFCIKQGVLSEKLAVELLTRASRRGISLERLLHEAGVLASDESKYDIYRKIAIELDKLVALETSAVASQQDAAPIAYKLGALYEQVQDQQQAEVYYSRALRTWGSEIQGDLTAARTCTALARIHQTQNRHEEVLPLLLKALEHRQHALGNNHEETITTLEEIAELEVEENECISALEHLRTAIAAREELGQEGAKLLKTVILHGDCLTKLANYDEAKAAYNKAMSIVQAAFGSGGSHVLAAVIEKLGDMYLKQDLARTATAQYKYALLIFEGAGKEDCSAAQNLKEKLAKLSEAEQGAV